MRKHVYKLILGFLRLLPPEFAGSLSLKFIKFNFLISKRTSRRNASNLSKQSPVKYKHLNFKNYLGIAAGLDKEGRYFPALGSLGFSFIEVGTFTPVSQYGNDYPRIKRLKKDKSLINRLGFNNPGIRQGIDNIKRNKKSFSGILGVSIGKNKDTKLEDASKDYKYCLRNCFYFSDYIAVNISSPNTEGLRNLSQESYFFELINQIHEEYENLIKKYKIEVPLLLKLSPDEDDGNIENLLELSLNKKFSGFIISNTTQGELMGIKGGISGELLKDKSLEMLKKVNSLLDQDVLLISSGGISSKQDIEERLDNGANLIQIYTSFVYEGPPIIDKLLN